MKHYGQSNLGLKRVIWLTLLHHFLLLKEVKQGRNLKAGAGGEALEGCCLLACSILLSYRTQDHGDTPWAGPIHINH